MKKYEICVTEEEMTAKAVGIALIIIFLITMLVTTCAVIKKHNEQINNIENIK